MKKILTASLISLMLATNVSADTDGENSLSKKNSMDFYASVRSLYLQDRQQKIANSNAITETQNDSDWEEIETQ